MPRESIPVGGWRSSEQRTVEVAYGKAKARDVVPGWPRGRSTSRPVAAGSVWPWVHVVCMITGRPIGVFPRMELQGLSRRAWPADSKTLHLDHVARLEERLGQQAEERRKADMMEAWYEQQRIDARGNLFPESGAERALADYGIRYILGMDLGQEDAWSVSSQLDSSSQVTE